ncbi:MAG: putative lipoprotein [Proteobacteria bacterium]|nr:putative lipoprotein [Pseudomonadota bacterium]
MKTATTGSKLALALLFIILPACAGITPAAYSGLQSSSYLTPNSADGDGRTPYRYASPVDWRSYNSVILQPVIIYGGADQQFDGVSDEDKQILASSMRDKFTAALSRRFAFVGEPTPNTLRIRLTLTGASTTTPVLGTLSRFDLAGGVYNGVQAVRGGEGAMTGAVIFAVEIYDASTSTLLAAYIEKQYPNAYNISASLGALAAAQVGIEKGAERLVDRLR